MIAAAQVLAHVEAGEETIARGCAHGVGAEGVGVAHAIGGQGVDMRRLNIAVAVGTDAVGAVLVGLNDEDIGMICIGHFPPFCKYGVIEAAFCERSDSMRAWAQLKKASALTQACWIIRGMEFPRSISGRSSNHPSITSSRTSRNIGINAASESGNSLSVR